MDQSNMDTAVDLTLFERVGHRFQCIIVYLNRLRLRVFNWRNSESIPPVRDPILLHSAIVLAEKIRTKKLSSVQVVQAFYERIKETNPQFNFLVEDRYDEALKEAANADTLIASNEFTVDELAKNKPFLGVPFSTKDSNAIKGMKQSSGLYWRRNHIADKDCEAVALFRQAGAIPIILTNVPEMVLWWETNNTIYGRTKNAYDTRRISGGSSGGESTVLALSGSPCGLGSDVGGSIRLPAHFNGIFGHKPSEFIVSVEGIYPEPTCDAYRGFATIGPMTRYACDLKPILKVLAGEKISLLNLDEPVDLSKVKVFYQENDCGGLFVSTVEDDIQDTLLKVIEHLKFKAGLDVQRVELSKMKRAHEIWMANMNQQNTIDIAEVLSGGEGKINPKFEMLKWCCGESKHTFVALMTCDVQRYSPKFGSLKHKRLMETGDKLRSEFQEMLGNNGVFVYPVHPTVAPYHSESLVRGPDFGYVNVFNVLGLPATSIPICLGREKLPIGIQVVANINQDRLCLAMAEELEKTFGGWHAPKLFDE